LREDDNIERIDDGMDIFGAEGLSAEGEARIVEKSLFELFDKVDENIAASPFTRMDAAQKIDAWAPAAAIGELDGVTLATFPSEVGEGDELCEGGVGSGSCGGEGGLDLNDIQIRHRGPFSFRA